MDKKRLPIAAVDDPLADCEVIHMTEGDLLAGVPITTPILIRSVAVREVDGVYRGTIHYSKVPSHLLRE